MTSQKLRLEKKLLVRFFLDAIKNILGDLKIKRKTLIYFSFEN